MHGNVSDDFLPQEISIQIDMLAAHLFQKIPTERQISALWARPPRECHAAEARRRKVIVCLLPDLQFVHALGALLNVDVDGKMSVDVSHLVLVALCDASHQVLDDRFDGSEGCDILSRAVVDFDLDKLLSGLVLCESESDSNVGEIFRQFA